MTGTLRSRIAVDIGGTFVDAVAYDLDTHQVRMAKAPTTPLRPASGVLAALDGLGVDLAGAEAIVHGTTLGLNAVLQRAGAPVGLITTAGFRDVLEVGRSSVPVREMYNFQYAPPPPLVARRHRVEVAERINASGEVITPLDERGVLDAARFLLEECGISSIAVALLHSYANPRHEHRVAEIIHDALPGAEVSLSSDIAREYREYERTSTAVLDAYVRPVLRNYIDELESALAAGGFAGQFYVMGSSGGAVTARMARRTPLTTVLSGPAGAISGATFLSSALDWARVLTLDVGGTSVDSCVIQHGRPSDVYEAQIDDLPLLVPVFDIRTIGAGGGSVATVDDGLLAVGPRSAGAVPGPACYGQGGTEPTVTDAAVVLGYIDPDRFLDGAMAIDTGAARKAIDEMVGQPLGLSCEEAAAAIVDVLIARLVGALGEITSEQGLDPREFRLLAVGGAGPLLGPLIARELSIGATVVPRFPAAFSAWGMLMADTEYELSQAVLRPLDGPGLAAARHVGTELSEQGSAVLREQGIAEADRHSVIRLDLRYRGQEHALGIELHPGDSAADIFDRFYEAHSARYGHAIDDSADIVNARVRVVGRTDKPALERLEAPAGAEASQTRTAYDFGTRAMVAFTVVDRSGLAPGWREAGPLVVDEGTSTTIVHSDQVATVDDHGHLVIAAGVAA